ncbi:hypothetical protein C0J52_11471, partial [Blattella germanica]
FFFTSWYRQSVLQPSFPGSAHRSPSSGIVLYYLFGNPGIWHSFNMLFPILFKIFRSY